MIEFILGLLYEVPVPWRWRPMNRYRVKVRVHEGLDKRAEDAPASGVGVCGPVPESCGPLVRYVRRWL